MKKATKTAKPSAGKQMSEESRTRVERATVRLVQKGGRGVLVPGEFIITATHCIVWSGTGRMAMGGVDPTEIETPTGAKFRLGTVACEPVSDVAVLGELDYQDCPDDVEAFEEWREQVEPVAISALQIEVGQSCPVFIFTHKREWLAGSVTRYGMPGQLAGSNVALIAEGIQSGTSGSPVVTADGLLLGIVSHTISNPTAGKACGSIPVVHMALPHWVLARIGLNLKDDVQSQ
jgi:hypothetical protein